jgi:hypothetical protein
MRTRLLLLVLLATWSGCRPGSPEGWPGEVVDSAGVIVVRNPVESLWSPSEGWWVQETLRIGGDESVPGSLFGYVTDATLGDDGRIYVLDQQAQAVRVFGVDGSLETTLGGPGEGPGELGRLVTSVVKHQDELLVVDWGQHRLTRYGVDGSVRPSRPLPHAPGVRSWWDEGADGGIYLRTLKRVTSAEGRWGAEDHLLRWDGAAGIDTLFTFDYPQTDLGTRGAARLPPVVDAPAWAVLPDGSTAWTDLSADELRIVSPDGSLRLVRAPSWVPHDPSEAEEEALLRGVAARIVMLGGSADAVEQVPVDYPRTLPVLTDVRAGPEETVWVQRAGSIRDVHPMALNTPDPPRGWGGGAWEVLDREGRFLGTVDLPPRFRLLDIRGDVLLGIQADQDWVDHVVVMNLIRPGTP